MTDIAAGSCLVSWASKSGDSPTVCVPPWDLAPPIAIRIGWVVEPSVGMLDGVEEFRLLDIFPFDIADELICDVRL